MSARDFDRYLTTLIDAAVREARADGSGAVEAHHLLLAVDDDTLAAAGLTREAVREALGREATRSLAAAGVTLTGVPRSTPPPGNPTLGAGARAALERAFATVARKRDLSPAHLLLGIVTAQLGTVPRALELAGVDRAALIARVRRHV